MLDFVILTKFAYKPLINICFVYLNQQNHVNWTDNNESEATEIGNLISAKLNICCNTLMILS